MGVIFEKPNPMSATFKFDLVTPERLLLSQDAMQVVLPGVEGEFTVLPDHAPVITTLKPGIISVSLPGGETRILVKGGFAEVGPQRVTVLAEQAVDTAGLGGARLAEELASAQSRLADATDDGARFLANSLIDEIKRLQAA